MSATLVHRGPDSDGTFVEGSVGLAARRLAIIDLADRRPADRERGRTDHRRPERRALQLPRVAARARARRASLLDERRHRGARPPLRRSTASASSERLRGMFAVALWDSERNRLVLARDRYGIKPLYYRESADELAFASELRALPRGEIDLDALEAFLAFNSVPGPLTIFRDVRKLQPGHVLTWENGRSELIRYARPAPGPGVRRAGRRGGGARRGAAGAPARLGPRAPRLRRAGRRAPLGRRSTPRCSPRSRPRRHRSRCARSRSASRSGASTSWPTRGSWPSATALSTASSCSSRTRRSCSPRSPRPSTSPSPTRRPCRPTSSRSSRPRT